MKRIAIDISHYNRLSGYGVVTRNIISKLIEKETGDEYYFFSNTQIPEIEQYASGKENFHFIVIKKPYLIYKLIYLSDYCQKYNIDVLVSLDQTLPLRKACSYISIIHDIDFWKEYHGLHAFKIRGQSIFHFFYYLCNFDGYFAALSDKIICPSNYTKKQVIQFFNTPSDKIQTVYWGMDHVGPTREFKKQNYILFPYLHANKDFYWRLGKKLIEEGITEKIIILRPVEKFESDDPRIVVINERNEKNEEYYASAMASIYISNGEGFGFVPLESIKYGTPVIYNNDFCLSETVGNGGIPISKMDMSLFVEAARSIVSDPKELSGVLQRGIMVVSKYSWTETTSKIHELITSL